MTEADICINNWGETLLKKAHQFYQNAEFCDLTLEFPDKTQMKVHRLILNGCTDFFHEIEDQYQQSDGAVASNVIVLLPNEITLESLGPIITFLYTGRLKIPLKNFDQVYSTAKLMKMDTIIQILDHHKREGSINNTKSFSLANRSMLRKRKFAEYEPVYQPPKRTCHKTLPSGKVNNLPPRPCRLEWPKYIIQNPVSFPDYQFCDIKCEDLIINKPNQPDSFDKAKQSSVNTNKTALNHNEIMKKIEKINESLRNDPLVQDEEFIGLNDSEINNNFHDDEDNEVAATNQPVNISEIQEFTQELKVRNQQIITNSGDNPSSSQSTDNSTTHITASEPLPSTDNSDKTTKSSNAIKIIEDAIIIDTKMLDNLQTNLPSSSNDLKKAGSDVKVILQDKSVRKTVPNGNTRKSFYNTSSTSTSNGAGSSNTSFPKQTNTAGYHCQECNLDINSYSSFRKHFKDIHTKSNCVFVCGICQYRSDRQIVHSYHQYVRHGIETRTDSGSSGDGDLAYNFPKCTTCSFIAMTDLQLDRHRLRHYSTQIQCLHCKTFFSSEPNFIAHLKSTQHISPTHKLYVCTYCAKDFIDESNLLTHLKFIHKDDLVRDSLEYNDETREQEQQQIVGTPLKADVVLQPEVIGNLLANVDLSEGFVIDNSSIATTSSVTSENLNMVQTAYVVVDENFLVKNPERNVNDFVSS